MGEGQREGCAHQRSSEGGIRQWAIDSHIPLSQSIHVIVRCPFAMQIDLEGIWIEQSGGTIVDSPRYCEEMLVVDHMVLGGDIISA